MSLYGKHPELIGKDYVYRSGLPSDEEGMPPNGVLLSREEFNEVKGYIPIRLRMYMDLKVTNLCLPTQSAIEEDLKMGPACQ